MRQDALDYRRFEDGGDDVELTTAVRAVLDVDLESEASAKTNLYLKFTSVRLKVEQNQLVTDGWGLNLGAIGLQGA